MTFRCTVTKPGNPRTAIMAVFADAESNVESVIHEEYGQHLTVSNVEPMPHRTAFQIGGDLITVRVK